MQVAVAQFPSQYLVQLPPVHVKLHVAPVRQSWVQLPPLHEDVQLLPGSHVWVQLPPLHVVSHVCPAEHVNLQLPVMHVVPPDASPSEGGLGVLQSQRQPVAHARAM
jgi:hypothetical protein